MSLTSVIAGVLSGADVLWKLDDNTDDSVGTINATSSTNTYGATLIATESGNMGVFDGSSAGILYPDDPLINTGTGYSGDSRAIFLVFDADTIDTTGNGRVLFKQGGATAGMALYTYLDGATPKLYFAINEADVNVFSMETTIATSTTYDVLLSFDVTADEAHLYVNGVEADSIASSLGLGADFGPQNANPVVGGWIDSSPKNHTSAAITGEHDGKIGFVAYWSEQGEPSAADAAALHYAVIGVTGTGSTTSPAQTASGAGTSTVTGTGTTTAPAQTGAGTGIVPITQTVQLYSLRTEFKETHNMRVKFDDTHEITARFG